MAKKFVGQTLTYGYSKLSFPKRNKYHAQRALNGSSYVDKNGNVVEYSNSSRLFSRGYLQKSKESAEAYKYKRAQKTSRKK